MYVRGITIAFVPDNSPYANSWRIDGKEAWEDGNRERWLKEFYENGFMMEVAKLVVM